MTAASPHLLLSTQLYFLPCCWNYISEAPHPTDTTEMLKSAKHSRNIGLKKSVSYVKMNHQPCLGNKIPLSRVLPGSFPNCAGIFCKRQGKRQNAAVSKVLHHYRKSVRQRGGGEPAPYLLWKSYISGMFPKRTSFLFLSTGGIRMTMAGLSISAL